MKKSIDELLHESRQIIKQTKRKVCRECGETKVLVQSNFCEDCYKEVRKRKDAALQGRRLKDDNGYVRTYDENGKLVLEHRLVMSRHLGRPLKKNEVIIWRDGNRSNNDLGNLMLSFKSGTPIEKMKCTECGTVGQFTIEMDE